jgi:DNA-binding transcriptional LysR family regulator
MIGPRRLLPSIPALLALEALDRLGTASAAAEELCLTQGAVSRQVQALEGQLGVALVVRERQRLRLTPAAQDYVAQVRVHLQAIAQASLRLRANPGGGSLDLAILPAFGMHWLAPRLAGFAALHPQVTLNLSTRLRPFDFADEGFDAAIHFGRADWPGADHLLLLDEQIQAVCAPGLPQAETAADLLARPLLQLESRTGAWGKWFSHHGLLRQKVSGMLFDQFATMREAAIHGLGTALLPTFLIQRDLAEGRLVAAFGQPVPGQGSYYLVTPRDRPERAALTAFRAWIASQVG